MKRFLLLCLCLCLLILPGCGNRATTENQVDPADEERSAFRIEQTNKIKDLDADSIDEIVVKHHAGGETDAKTTMEDQTIFEWITLIQKLDLKATRHDYYNENVAQMGVTTMEFEFLRDGQSIGHYVIYSDSAFIVIGEEDMLFLITSPTIHTCCKQMETIFDKMK